MNTGYAINPARDLGPRLFLWTVGYGEDLFKSLNHWYWLIPVLGPLIGAMLGGWLYKGFQLLSVEDERPKVESKIDENTKKIETEEKYWA
ncbi:unnamed protein product, partial [Mesorhabditis belari]|uniref:Uncharacterized protein n=1 Tax=Mesorhabditis belari TaxID=2138241 RepID=A0AAF3F0U2_9BILA